MDQAVEWIVGHATLAQLIGVGMVALVVGCVAAWLARS